MENKRLFSILAGAALLGLAGDTLFRGGGLGLNAVLWFAGVGIAIGFIERKDGTSPPLWDPLILLFVVFGGLCVWRDAPLIKFLCLVSAGVLAVAYSLRSKGIVPQTAVVQQAIVESVLLGLSLPFRPFYIFFNETFGERRATVNRFRTPLLILRGLAFSIPFLLIFGMLFSSADERFGDFLRLFFSFDLQEIWSHIFLTGLFSWITLGFLHRLVERRSEAALADTRQRIRLGGIELMTALGLLNALFALFVGFQFPHFFGGMSFLVSERALTLAQYYRHGFFELMVVVAGTIPILLFSRWGVREDSVGHQSIVGWLAGILLCLVVCIVGSVFHKFFLYEQAFGLTQLRLYTVSFLLWLVVVLVFVARVMLRRSDIIIFPAGVAALAFVLALCVINPDGLIVRVNAGHTIGQERRDASYLASLSADAVPAVLEHFEQFGPEDRALFARTYLRHWSFPPSDLRAWSVSRWIAARLIADNNDRLMSLMSVGPTDDRKTISREE